MNKIVHIKIFNDVLDQFFDYLDTNFIEIKSDLILSKSAIDFIRKNNPRLVVEQFMTIIHPYRKQISECNEDFFLNFENNLPISGSNMLVGMKLKNVWLSNQTTEHQKAYIWLYFQRLIKAGEKVLV